MTSASFNIIFSSSTLVPIGKLPGVKPLFNVVPPIPDPDNFDLSTIIEVTRSNFFCL